jgi:hypothetical protein
LAIISIVVITISIVGMIIEKGISCAQYFARCRAPDIFAASMSMEDWRISQDSLTGRWRAKHRSSGETIDADTNAKIHEEVEEFELSRARIHSSTG